MPARTLPNLGLQAFFNLGEDGWKDEMDSNILKLSVLVQGGVIQTVSSTPGAPAEGDVYLFADDHPTEANQIAIWDDGAWVYLVPLEGWRVYDRSAEMLLLFDGSVWAEFSGAGGAGEPAAVVTKSTAAEDLLNVDQGTYARYTFSGAKTLTVRPDVTEPLLTDGEWNIRNANTGDLTIVEGLGVSINPPAGGTLVVPTGGTVTLKRVAVNTFDLLGQTVPV